VIDVALHHLHMSHLSKTAVFIVAAKRTAFGAFGGKLKDFSCTDLAVEAAKAALADGNVDPTIVDSVFVGNVSQTNADTPYMYILTFQFFVAMSKCDFP
jgi:acetyl-CoA acetyltransferase